MPIVNVWPWSISQSRLSQAEGLPVKHPVRNSAALAKIRLEPQCSEQIERFFELQLFEEQTSRPSIVPTTAIQPTALKALQRFRLTT